MVATMNPRMSSVSPASRAVERNVGVSITVFTSYNYGTSVVVSRVKLKFITNIIQRLTCARKTIWVQWRGGISRRDIALRWPRMRCMRGFHSAATETTQADLAPGGTQSVVSAIKSLSGTLVCHSPHPRFAFRNTMPSKAASFAASSVG